MQLNTPTAESAVFGAPSESVVVEPPAESATFGSPAESVVLEPPLEYATFGVLAESAFAEPPSESVTFGALPESAVLSHLQKPKLLRHLPNLQFLATFRIRNFCGTCRICGV